MNTNPRTDFKSFSARRQFHDRDRHGFTLTELLVVLVTVGILAVVLLPALASNQPGNTKAFQCLNNMRQLGLAWLLYANDNHDRLVSNSDASNVGGTLKTKNWICPALGGSNVPLLDWDNNFNDFNTGLLTIDQPFMGTVSTALMGPYVAKSVKIFVCPSDNYLSAAQRASPYPALYGLSSRIRSCAMNGAMGDGSKFFGYYNAKKLTDLHNPGPANCFVITDEHPDANDDAIFFVDPSAASGTGTTFIELPGSMHDKAAGMVFADGHSDLHRWMGSIDTPPVKYVAYFAQGVCVCGDTGAANDLTWLAQHTPAN